MFKIVLIIIFIFSHLLGNADLYHEEKEVVNKPREEYLKAAQNYIVKQKNELDIDNKDYFKEIVFTTEETFCPNLKEKFNNIYVVQTLEQDIKKGKITCVIRDKQDLSHIIYKQTFYNPIEHDLYKNMTLTQLDIDNSTVSEKAIDTMEYFTKNQSLLSLASALKTDNNNIIKLPNLMSAIVSLDSDIIDIPGTLQQGMLTFKDNKVSSIAPTVSEDKSDFLFSIKELLDSLSNTQYTSWLSFINKEDIKIEDETNVAYKKLDSALLFVFNSLISANIYSKELLYYILMIVFPSSLFYLLFQTIKNKQQGENLLKKTAIAMIPGVFLFYFVWGSHSINFQIEDNDSGVKNISLNVRKVQQYIAVGYQSGDNLANDFASKVIDNYIINKNIQHSFFTVAQIRKQELEKKQLLVEYEYLKQYDEKCIKTFDILKTSNILSNMKIDNEYNPYLNDKIFLNIKNNFKNEDKKINYTYFFKRHNSIPNITINSCYLNRQQMILNKKRIALIDKNIAIFNDPTKLENNIELNKLLQNFTLGLNEKYGYISVAFLPVLKFLEDTLIEDKTIDQARLKKLLFDKDMDLKGLAEYASSKAFLLTFFDTSSIMNIISKLTDATIGNVPFVGNSLSKLATVSATIYLIDHMVGILANLKIVIFFIISIIMFILINIQKIITFLSAPFYLIYLFTTNQHQKVIQGFAQLLFIIIKPLLFVFSMLIALLFIELSDTIYNLFTKIEFMSIMNISSGIESFIIQSGLSAMFEVVQVVISTFIVYYILVNTSNKIFETVGIKIEDYTKQAVESIQHSVSNYLK